MVVVVVGDEYGLEVIETQAFVNELSFQRARTDPGVYQDAGLHLSRIIEDAQEIAVAATSG